MNSLEFQERVTYAKKLWPKRVPTDSDWSLRLASLIIRSRRKGLTKREYVAFDQLVSENVDELLDIGERWLVAIADTYVSEGDTGDGAAAAMVVMTAIRMIEKFHSAVYELESERAATFKGPDVHINLAKRLARMWKTDAHLWKLFRKLIEILVSDKQSILGKFDSLANRDIYRDIESSGDY